MHPGEHIARIGIGMGVAGMLLATAAWGCRTPAGAEAEPAAPARKAAAVPGGKKETDTPAPRKDLEWRLGVQAWTFNRFTFFEAVDKVKSLGLHWIEAYPGQKLGGTDEKAVFHHDMPAAAREEAKKKLAEAGVRLVNYGVVGLPGDEAGCRKVFDFAKEMGIETIVSEPAPASLPMIDRLCKEYGLRVALHNHPRPARYWSPDIVLKAVKGCSPRIGACADTGHWMRSGVPPLEALKKLEGRIVSFHFKDLNAFGDMKAHDVPWGTGKADVKALLAEMKRQGFSGVFSIEYEYHWENSLPELKACAACFKKTAAALGVKVR